MSNAELIERAQPLYADSDPIIKELADALESSDKRIAELEAAIVAWKADQKENMAIAVEECKRANEAELRIAELVQVNCSRLDEAERKLAVAREALKKIGEIASPYRDGVKFNYVADVAQESLAQIGGEDARS